MSRSRPWKYWKQVSLLLLACCLTSVSTNIFFFPLDQERLEFVKNTLTGWGPALGHTIRRSEVYSDVLKLFSDDDVMLQCPLKIRFECERAIDTGGVCRDMVSAFWEKAYQVLFDGMQPLDPSNSPPH